uniref:Uncharacterized protein n=1 Tax=Octactis speculum TaxID=3111310 RepID=A0A7S2DNT7_9STRA
MKEGMDITPSHFRWKQLPEFVFESVGGKAKAKKIRKLAKAKAKELLVKALNKEIQEQKQTTTDSNDNNSSSSSSHSSCQRGHGGFYGPTSRYETYALRLR